jgi:4-amino-4-deoxy-L-arabinose transferase-like glycosyltransferase
MTVRPEPPTSQQSFPRSIPGNPGVMSPSLALWLLVAAAMLLLLFRCWVAMHMDFESDEPYYWLWSRHLALSFYDHPPMVAYLIRLGTQLFGQTAFGVRSIAILAILLASALTVLLAMVLFGDWRVGLASALWLYLCPHAGFFSVVMYPDAPAMLFWVLCCATLAMVWRSGRGEWWYLAGLAGGLLLLSKYTGFFLLGGVGLWLLLSQEMRPWLKRREPYLGVLIALALFSPVILWNAEHGWISFAKQFGRAFDYSPDGGIANVAAYLGIQTAFVSPLIFIFVVGGVGIAFWRGLVRQQANWLLLALTSAPVFLYFLYHALSDKILPQWPSPAYPTAIVAACASFLHLADDRARHPILSRAFAAAPWLALAMTVAMYLQMTIAIVPVPAAADPLSRFAGWAGLARDARAAMIGDGASYIATSEYGTNGALSFYLPDVLVFQASQAIRYTNEPPLDQSRLIGTTGIYLTAMRFDDSAGLRPHFDSVELLGTIQRTRSGDPIEPFRIYRLTGYRGGLPY